MVSFPSLFPQKERTKGPKETVYDEQVVPHLEKVRDICKEHKIPFVLVFGLDKEQGTLVTSTSIYVLEETDADEHLFACAILARIWDIQPDAKLALIKFITDPEGANEST